MTSKISIIGVPGSGKTTYLANITRERLANTLVTGLNNACIYSYLNKIGKKEKEGYFRTIYGLIQRKMLKDEIIDKSLFKYLNPNKNLKIKWKIAKKFGLSFSNDELEYSEMHQIIASYSQAIHKYGEFDEAYNIIEKIALTNRVRDLGYQVLDYIKKLRKEGRFYDYVFLIEDAYKFDLSVIFENDNITKVYVDEAQDLTPIAYHILNDSLNENIEEFVLIGDPAQAIYGFLGSDPTILIKHGSIKALNQTYRFGKDITKLANKILDKLGYSRIYKIEPQNRRDMIMKLPYNENNLVKVINELNMFAEMSNKTISVGILVRTNSQVRKIHKILIKNGIAHSFLKSSYNKLLHEVLEFASILKDIKEGHITTNHIKCILEAINTVSEVYNNKPLEFSVLSYDVVEKIKKWLLEDKSRIDKLVRWGTYYIWKKYRLQNEMTLVRLREMIYAYLSNPPKAKIYVDTMHASKGLEFDVVVLIDAIPKIIRKNMEILEKHELHTLYVGITRAKHGLIIMETSNGYFEYFNL